MLIIQTVLDYYKAVSYTCGYISKTENESSEAMKKAASKAFFQKLSEKEKN